VVESDQIKGSPKMWADPLITQVCSYLGEGSIEHDDLLDTTTQALRLFMNKHIGSLTKKIDPIEERRKRAQEDEERVKRRKRGSTNPYG
jgi:hypothetical protein